VDITGYHQLGLRPYDPVSGRWLTYDSVWNERDPNAYTFCGGDPVNGFDSNGKCVENAPNAITFGIAPVMQTSIQTTVYFNDGSSATTGLPGQPALLYDPSQVAGNSYNTVTQPTGQYQYYASQNGLPADYGQTTSTPITTLQVENQQDMQFLIGTATVLATVFTDTEPLLEEGGASTIFENAANGRAFEQQGLTYLQGVNNDVAGQVSVQPFTASGDLANYRVRLDALGTDSSDNINLYDFKSSPTAGFTPNQQLGYPLLEQFGGRVVGDNGGLAYPAGRIIPPTPVTIMRPGSF
jgi:hypothetical protein